MTRGQHVQELVNVIVIADLELRVRPNARDGQRCHGAHVADLVRGAVAKALRGGAAHENAAADRHPGPICGIHTQGVGALAVTSRQIVTRRIGEKRRRPAIGRDRSRLIQRIVHGRDRGAVASRPADAITVEIIFIPIDMACRIGRGVRPAERVRPAAVYLAFGILQASKVQ